MNTVDNQRFKRGGMSDFIIRIVSQNQATLQGTIEHLASGESQQYRSLMELLNLIMDKLQECGSPQPTTAYANWGPGLQHQAVQGTSAEPLPPSRAKSPAFLIRVHYWQDTTWQGTVHWLDTNKPAKFRSALELMVLLQTAVGYTLATNSAPMWKNRDHVV